MLGGQMWVPRGLTWVLEVGVPGALGADGSALGGIGDVLGRDVGALGALGGDHRWGCCGS